MLVHSWELHSWEKEEVGAEALIHVNAELPMGSTVLPMCLKRMFQASNMDMSATKYGTVDVTY